MWIVPWDPFLMKKLLKSEICGSVNSARCVLIGCKEWEKSNFMATVHAQCMNSSYKSHKRVQKKKKKNKKEEEEKHQKQTLGFSAQSKHSLRRLISKTAKIRWVSRLLKAKKNLCLQIWDNNAFRLLCSYTIISRVWQLDQF